MSIEESAAMIIDCVAKHSRSRAQGKSSLQSLYVCETNTRRVDAIKEELKSNYRGVEYLTPPGEHLFYLHFLDVCLVG